MLLQPISIVLGININSSSSTNWQRRRHQRLQNSVRILQIKVTLHMKISSLATLQFKESRKKKRKKLLGSGEIAKKKKDWKKMVSRWKDRWKLYENLKLWYYFYRSNLKVKIVQFYFKVYEKRLCSLCFFLLEKHSRWLSRGLSWKGSE